MTTRPNRFTRFLGTIGAAVDVAADLKARRVPRKDALRTLGIDENAFRDVQLR